MFLKKSVSLGNLSFLIHKGNKYYYIGPYMATAARKELVKLSSEFPNNPIEIPVITFSSGRPGPRIIISAGVHGDELNGIFVIHKLISFLSKQEISGSICCVPCVNIPSIRNNQREFFDGVDLNRVFPGKKEGKPAEQYAHALFEKIIKGADIHLDLHTAGNGRTNPYYLLADISDPKIREISLGLGAQIILNKKGRAGTLREAASNLGILSITAEIGGPSKRNQELIQKTSFGIINFLSHLKMIPANVISKQNFTVPTLCSSSQWIYTDQSGILEVQVDCCELVSKGQIIATLNDICGAMIQEYLSPHDGIVIGKRTNPIVDQGSKIVNVGVLSNPRKMDFE